MRKNCMNVPETSYLHSLHVYERSPVHCDVTVILSNMGTASVYCLSTGNLSGVFNRLLSHVGFVGDLEGWVPVNPV